jgi:hypothetical protein
MEWEQLSHQIVVVDSSAKRLEIATLPEYRPTQTTQKAALHSLHSTSKESISLCSLTHTPPPVETLSSSGDINDQQQRNVMEITSKRNKKMTLCIRQKHEIAPQFNQDLENAQSSKAEEGLETLELLLTPGNVVTLTVDWKISFFQAVEVILCRSLFSQN